MVTPKRLFVSYSHKDDKLREQLQEHLALLKYQSHVETWTDRRILAGGEWAAEIDENLERADVVLLLVSASFLDSEYCYAVEMTRALELDEQGTARVIPIIVRPCDWETAPFGKLKALPKDGKPVVKWEPVDDGWRDVAKGIRAAVTKSAEPRDLSGGELEPQPAWRDEATRELSEHLTSLYSQRETILIAGQPTEEIDREILDVRRQIRQGPLLQPGEFLGEGRYRLLKRVGKGGFAEVWKAWDTKRRGLVALKCLHGQYSEDRTRRERFFRGARKMDELAHPRIVRVLEVEGSEEGWHYFAMEYVGGGNFEQAVLRGDLDPEARLRIVQQAGEALAHAHQKGIVHRDVKPSNILHDEAGYAKLTDFDLVAAGDSTGGTKTHAMMGTLLFAAPEALRSAKDAGPAADVYSLAVTAIFAIHGQALDPLFFRDPEATIATLGCGEPLQDVLRKAMAVDPDDRYASIEEFCEHLKRAPVGDAESAPILDLNADESVQDSDSVSSTSEVTARIQPETVHKTLQLTNNLAERATVFEGIPDQLADADACLALVEQLKEGCRGGFDLFWLWWIVEEVGRRWRPGSRAQDLLDHLFDHIPQPENPERLWTLDTALDGPMPLWQAIPAGEGQVGSPRGENGRANNEGPVHRVEIVQPYWLGAAPVTNAQYALFDPDKAFWQPSRVSEEDLASHPRVYVTWYEAISFCRWLATQPGFAGSGPRLPVEEEWEIACRAGTVNRFWRGDDEEHLAEVGWYDANSGERSHRAGRKLANEWHLYDLHGNAWEWTASPREKERYKDRPQATAWRIDPATPPADLAAPPRAGRVLRGGGYGSTALWCRSADRVNGDPRDGIRDRGFRVLLSSAPSRP